MTDQTQVGALGSLLRTYRGRAGLSQRALAELSTVSIRTIRDLESGRAMRPRRETVSLLADALRIGQAQRVALDIAINAPDESALPAHLAAVPLPVPLDAMVGRTAELRLLRDLVTTAAQRVVAIVGIGGVGKSRLAVELARQVRRDEGWLALWIPASATSDPELRSVADGTLAVLRRSIHRALDAGLLDTECADLDRVATLIGTTPVLLVLDGYDRPEVANEALLALLDRCPALRIVITTRCTTVARGWRVVPLAALAVPEPGRDTDLAGFARLESVELLARHIRHGRPDFRLDARNAPTIASICAAVDGIPAALTHAGRACMVHTLAEVLDQLTCRPTASVTSSGPIGASGTVDAILDALARLTMPTRTLLAQLSTIDGRWSLADACALSGRPGHEVADALRALLLGGLVRRVGDTERTQFEVLRLVRAVILPDASWTTDPASPRGVVESPPDACAMSTAVRV